MLASPSRDVRFELDVLEGPASHRDARGEVTQRRGFLVTATDGVRRGVGEASPLPGHSEDTLDEVRAALDRLREGAPSADELERWPAAARFAVETALLDLAARARSVPLHGLLGSASPASLDVQRLVPLGVDPSVAITAGTRALKLKLGGDDDVGRVGRARALGPALVLRVDVNGAGVGPALSDALVAARIDYCEDPCPLAELGPRPFAVALDLRPATIEVQLRAVEAGLVEVVVLKPTVLGGLSRTAALAARARRLGARVVLSHTLESPVGLAAIAHLALAIGRGEVHGLGHHAGLAGFRARTALEVPPWLGPDRIEPPSVPGLGT